jgi:signal transduction histidine kinase
MGAYTSALIANVEKLKATNTEEEELDKMKVNAEQILSSLRETIWVLNNKEVSLADFSDGFKNYCFKILKNFEHIDFDAEEDIIENKNLPAATAIHLNKILQEALQNIIKHSKATGIIYSIKCSGKFKILISDNGIGFDTEKISSGNGLDNIAWRAKEAGVGLLHQSYPLKGTSITITET